MNTRKHFGSVKKLMAALLLIGCIESVTASSVSDLTSRSQEVRDAAAKILRQTYMPPPRTNWDLLISKLKLGSPKTNVLELLDQYTNHVEGGGGSGVVESERYRLDDLWLLECSYTGSNGVLTHLTLIENMLRVSVKPPAGFTGTWRTYFVNGQKSAEGRVRNGLGDGESIAFYPTGSKMFVNHSVNGVLDGEVTGYYPSGKIKYRGQYHTNSQVGVWVWYKEDGAVESKIDFSKL